MCSLFSDSRTVVQSSAVRDAAVACPNDSFSIAVAIILFPLIIEVVQMMMFLRARGLEQNESVSDGVGSGTTELTSSISAQHTFFLLRDKTQCCDLGKCHSSHKHNEYGLLLPSAGE